MKSLECEHCDAEIIKSYGNEAKLRSKLIKWNERGMFAVCKSCGHDQPIHTDVLKSLQTSFVYEVGEPTQSPKNQKK